MRNWILAMTALALLGLAAPVAQAKEKAGAKTTEKAAKLETLTGTLSMVIPGKKLVVVKDSSGVPFDFKAAGAAIQVGGKKAKLEDLNSATNKQVTVKFIPLRSGNVAKSVEVSS
jgi:outer membrane lipoprotein-sorting protein